MKATIRELKCGECGGKEHKLSLKGDGNVLVECIRCNSMSIIMPDRPTLIIENYSGLGTLCVF